MSATAVLERPCAPAGQPVDDGQDDLVHIVGDVQYWLDRLGLKIPRALCGELLVADQDRPDPAELGAPVCPRCAELAGWDVIRIDEFNRRSS